MQGILNALHDPDSCYAVASVPEKGIDFMKNHATPIHLLDEATVSGTIIVVDDTKENLHLLKSLLDSIGIKVRPSTRRT